MYSKALTAITDKAEVFQTLISDTTRKVRWAEVLNSIYSFYVTHPTFYLSNIRQNIFKKEDFKLFEAIGIDYNYVDYEGRNFLQHIVYENTHRYNRENDHRKFLFPDIGFEYVIERTKDIYHLDRFGRHILFDMLEVSQTGLEAEYFSEFITKYPPQTLDLHDITHRNLINFAIYRDNVALINYLIDRGVSYTHVTEDNETVLTDYPFMPHNKAAIKLFKKLALTVDIAFDTDRSFLHSAFRYIDSDNESEVRKKYRAWAQTALTLISEGEFYYTQESLKRLEAIFIELKSDYPEYIMEDPQNLFKKSEQFVRYKQIDLAVPAKTMGDFAKRKI